MFSKKLHLLLREKPITILDIGARGSLVEPWLTLQLRNSSVIRVFGFEPDKKEYENLNSSDNKTKYFPFALWNKEEEISLNIATRPGTSSIHPPNFDLIKNFKEKNWKGRMTEKKIKIQAKILDKISKENNIDVDFIKIDTQGSELEILQGGSQTLLNDCFGCTVETWTLEVHKDQYLSYDVMKFLQESGFQFFDFQIGASWKRKYLDENFHGKGQTVGLDFLYLKSPEAFFNLEPSLEKTAKAVAIADVWGFPDYAIQLIECYEKKYSDSSLNFLKSEIIINRKKSGKDKFLEKLIPNYLLDKINVRYFHRKPSFPNIH